MVKAGVQVRELLALSLPPVTVFTEPEVLCRDMGFVQIIFKPSLSSTDRIIEACWTAKPLAVNTTSTVACKGSTSSWIFMTGKRLVSF